jgi:hypothetical protein
MAKVLHRVIGLLLAVIGAGMLAYLAKALYTPSDRWVNVLVAINMPTMLLLTLIGAGLVGAGLWMLLHPNRPDARA